MPSPFKFPGVTLKLDTLYRALDDATHVPFIGLTQGGSSRKFKGAKPAATKANFKPKKVKNAPTDAE